ncbi:MAG TPA: DUF5362 family protein [Flavihumibacter sp.]|jgi:hypothetical protein
MNTTPSHLFELKIDDSSNSYLQETAKWAKFLSILGFVLCGIMVLVGLGMATALNEVPSMYGGVSSVLFSVIYIAMAALYFFPCLYLYRFAVNMKNALQANEPAQLQESFKNLKSTFRFVGILTIIVLALYALVIVGAGLVAAFSF